MTVILNYFPLLQTLYSTFTLTSARNFILEVWLIANTEFLYTPPSASSISNFIQIASVFPHVLSLFQSDVHAEAPQILGSSWCNTQMNHPGSDPQCWEAGCPPWALFYPLGEVVGSGRPSAVLTWGRDKWSDCGHSPHPSVQSFSISVNQWSTWAFALSSGIFVIMCCL